MAVFGNYARYYDLLYRDKQYAEETAYLVRLINRFAPKAKSLIELGCGTGYHAARLAEQGYRVHGVDMSDEMLAAAKKRVAALPKSVASRMSFSAGDIREARVKEKFDVALSLFHVISYQTTNDDVRRAFDTARAHLRKGGALIFDVWYGPAVLTDRPAVRVKRLEDDAIRVVRLAEPVIYANENWVDVNYHVFITDKRSGNVDELQETHRMRYLFQPELELLLNEAGFEVKHAEEWLSGAALGFNTWGACFVAIAK